jgi:hypothetical protein
MTPNRNEDGRTPRAEAIFKAHVARHEAHLAKAMAAHERAMATAERRISEAMRAAERAMKAAERGMNDALLSSGHGMDPIELIRAIKGRRKPPAGPNRRDLEGGDGVPVVPRPKPNPLAGAAAASIE